MVVAAMLSTPILPQDHTADLRSRFENEPNPIQKAKLMPTLGEAEFQQIRRDVEDRHFADALAELRDYRNQAQSCAKGLESTKTDAEKHPGGFKQLEISLQESLRRVDSLLPSMTSDEQASFLEVRKDLDELRRRLTDELFPRRVPAAPKPDKAERREFR